MRPETEELSYKDKWCPFARTMYLEFGKEDQVTAAGVNREDNDFNPFWARCIGPRCMMFRASQWGYDRRDNNDPEDHPEFCGLVASRP